MTQSLRCMRGRRTTLLASVAMLGALAGAAPAAGADKRGRPSAQELWQDYPLSATPEARATATPPQAPAQTPAATAADARSQASRPPAQDSGGIPSAIWLGLAAILAIGAVSAWAFVAAGRRRRRLERDEPGPAAPEPATVRAPKRDAAEPASVRGPPAPQPWLLEPTAGRRSSGNGSPEPQVAKASAVREPVASGSAPPPERSSSGPLPPAPQRAWTAEVDWRHGEGHSTFRVVATEDGGDAAATLAESAPIEWPPTGPAGVQAMTDAAEALEISLLAAGWRPLPPGEAWYAKRFAWQPQVAGSVAPDPEAAPPRAAGRSDGPGRFVRSTQWPVGTEELWRCEIKWDAGYVSSRFRAVAYAPGHTRGRAVVSSPSFRWLLMDDPDPKVADHRFAVRDLAAALELAGWEPAGRGAHWYAERFVWRRPGSPPERVEPMRGEAGPTR